MSRAGSLCRKSSALVERNKNQLCDYMTTKTAQLAGIPVLWCRDSGRRFPSNYAYRVVRLINQANTGNTLFMHTASLAHVIRPLLLYFHAVCTWELWNLPLSWFVYERIRLNLLNPRVLKIEHGLHVKMLDSASFTVGPWKSATCLWGDFVQWILGNLLPSENMQWNYASFNVTLNYPMHEIMEFCVTSLGFDNWEQKYRQTLFNKPNHSHRVLWGRLFSKGKI